LRRVLESFAKLRAELGMRSMSMWEVAEAVGAKEVRHEVQLR
jgi:hypothetical protein